MENRKTVDQQIHPALALLAARRELFSRQGSVATTWRRRGAKTYGPYYRLSYREDARQRSVYLGGEGPLVEQVREQLNRLQEPLRRHRELNRFRRSVARSMRKEKQRVNVLLRSHGLRLQGFEVRGWRNSPIRRLLAVSAVRPIRPTSLTTLRAVPKVRPWNKTRAKFHTALLSPTARLEAVMAARSAGQPWV